MIRGSRVIGAVGSTLAAGSLVVASSASADSSPILELGGGRQLAVWVFGSGLVVNQIDLQLYTDSAKDNPRFEYQLVRVDKGGREVNWYPSKTNWTTIYRSWGKKNFCKGALPRKGDYFPGPCTTWNHGTWDYHENLRVKVRQYGKSHIVTKDIGIKV